jgi:hypothetical protein
LTHRKSHILCGDDNTARLLQQLAHQCTLQHLAGIGRPVVARDIANQTSGRIEREEIVPQRRLHESGGIARNRH